MQAPIPGYLLPALAHSLLFQFPANVCHGRQQVVAQVLGVPGSHVGGSNEALGSRFHLAQPQLLRAFGE